MNYRKWFNLFLVSMLIVLIPVFGVMGFNYYVDPYWNFQHAHAHNDYQNGFDERLQKTNLLVNNSQSFSSLLIGSSRVTYMNTNSFKHDEVFNYGLSSMHISEYSDYIAFAKKINDGVLNDIYVELSLHSYYANVQPPMGKPDTFFEQAQNRVLDYTVLFSKDTLDKSLVNYNASKANAYPLQRSYTRDNQVKTTYPNNRLSKAKEDFKSRYDKTNYTTDFAYNEFYKDELLKIKRENKDSKFVIFTDMAHEDRLKIYLRNPNFFDAYARSIREIVEVFGEVKSFHMQNDLTQNDKQWMDFYHFYPEIGDKMIHSLETGEGEGEIYLSVTENNVEQYLRDMKNWISE
ncbi:hypothetical protein [Paenisporosarcina antarctica]|uniref:Uncharacterized protein n=1 Tax=Paenisporosarcina antarctica TaxID=417367 RepID=A0A4P6ZZW5_9BACL|nr:hypothetical protein [Paenisporosarcina antarctica]QBP41838.1 hypothetical protein E2636_12070 [Paenisporosarcina antarctica]